ncbi:MAG: hypothetical protein HOD97_07445 [Candidatus Marinimicrobia bacterium]|nr:hypothetical protein [Candidatus Neomarinimicrobiota bacterium]MBT3618466.1 hypothetical protein [Candidatus Neomarinimicrobiota bacterium]MBT3829029.1 hypothetical protein [Candidatus Neomarinimicrobiota bacterium]MBT3997482.1 hypothetical protein [Candidatus Neomarinimicrobiota bacterium]MBT4281428.1 hypothetical protein [Candidatus Neomarinimicrobiota bacterium]
MKKFIWLYLSSFGITFAILSWTQESGFLPEGPGWMKGVMACIIGGILYYFLPRKME